MINQLRKKLMEKEVIVATRIDFTWPQLIEIIGSNELYDYVEFLAEYAHLTITTWRTWHAQQSCTIFP